MFLKTFCLNVNQCPASCYLKLKIPSGVYRRSSNMVLKVANVSVENRERLNTAYRDHNIIRRNIDNVHPAQLQLDSPKHLKLRDQILQNKKGKKSRSQNNKHIAGVGGLNVTGKILTFFLKTKLINN